MFQSFLISYAVAESRRREYYLHQSRTRSFTSEQRGWVHRWAQVNTRQWSQVKKPLWLQELSNITGCFPSNSAATGQNKQVTVEEREREAEGVGCGSEEREDWKGLWEKPEPKQSRSSYYPKSFMEGCEKTPSMPDSLAGSGSTMLPSRARGSVGQSQHGNFIPQQPCMAWREQPRLRGICHK